MAFKVLMAFKVATTCSKSVVQSEPTGEAMARRVSDFKLKCNCGEQDKDVKKTKNCV